MAYLPLFKNDVFISYPHTSEWDHWVEDFHARLGGKLAEILSGKVEVWRDTQLRSTHVFDEEIRRRVQGAGVLVVIATPSREESEWCDRELREFEEAARKNLGFSLETFERGVIQRAVVVAKAPSSGGRHRQILPRGLCCEFFQPGIPHYTEFASGSPEYDDRLSRLAQDLADLLREIRRRLTVRLTGTSPDARRHWEMVSHELVDRGYIVSPECWRESKGDEEADFPGILGASGLLVHILGGAYDDAAVRQLEIAREMGIPRIAWVPADIELGDRQRRLLGDMHEDPRGIELLDRRSAAEAKNFVLARLRRPQEVSPPPPVETKGLVYLACSDEDHPLLVEGNNASLLRDHLDRLGFEVGLPATDEEGSVKSSRLRRLAEATLRDSDGVILYWGTASQAWVEEMRHLCRKVCGKPGARRIRSKLIYISDPRKDMKLRYPTTREAVLIRQFGPFRPDDLEPFLQQLG